MVAVFKAILWLVVLLLSTLPWLANGNGSVLDVGSSFWMHTLTTLLAVAGITTFIVKADPQRGILFVYFIALIVVSSYWTPFSTARLAVYIAVVTFGAIAVQAIRENLPLYRDLVAAKANISGVLWSAFKLWLPMTALIGLGIWLNHMVENRVERLVYTTLPIDEYCRIANVPISTEFPCSQLSDDLQQADIHLIDNKTLAVAYVRGQFIRAKARAAELLANPKIDEPQAIITLASQLVPSLNAYAVIDPDPVLFGSKEKQFPSTLSYLVRKTYSDVELQKLGSAWQPSTPERRASYDARYRVLVEETRKEIEGSVGLQNLELRTLL